MDILTTTTTTKEGKFVPTIIVDSQNCFAFKSGETPDENVAFERAQKVEKKITKAIERILANNGYVRSNPLQL